MQPSADPAGSGSHVAADRYVDIAGHALEVRARFYDDVTWVARDLLARQERSTWESAILGATEQCLPGSTWDPHDGRWTQPVELGRSEPDPDDISPPEQWDPDPVGTRAREQAAAALTYAATGEVLPQLRDLSRADRAALIGEANAVVHRAPAPVAAAASFPAPASAAVSQPSSTTTHRPGGPQPPPTRTTQRRSP